MIETVCIRGLEAYRQGEPLDSLEPNDTDQPACFVLNPIIYDRHPTLLYGPGDSGKSFLALYFACLLASGGTSNDLAVAPDGHTVLYLNWEMHAPEMRSRVKQLRAAHPELHKSPLHRFCWLPLADSVEDLKREVKALGVTVVVVDSIVPATGGEVERADSVTRLFSALASLNCASLLIGHVAKGQDEDKRSPYGSVFYFNLARSLFEVRKIQEEESGLAKIALFHKKNNLGRRLAPMGFTLSISDARAEVGTFDPQEEPEFATGMPLRKRIQAVLKDHEARTVKAIADELDVDAESVRRTLNRFKGKSWTCLVVGGGKGNEAEWVSL